MNVLYKTASYHDLKLPSLSYLCTNRLAQSDYPTLSDVGLKTVCKHLDIPLEQHHSAIADAYACEQIFDKTMNWHNLNNLQEALFVASAIKMSKPESRSLAQAMTDLYGIIIGIGMDGIFTPSELPAIHDWMMRNQSHKNEALFHDVFLTLSEILNNNNLTKNEADRLLNIIRPFLNTGVNNSETIATQELLGIISGISADRIVNNTEAKELNNWLVEHDKLKDNPIAARIIKMVKRALADNYIDSDEEAELLLLFDKTLNPMEEDGSLSCVGKKFCLSGDFTHGKKSDIEADIISRGGECVSGVTKKCDYVVVGGFGSEQYAFGKYGTKVKKAMTLQDAGHPIKVIQEAELFV
jgi:DNA polymerase-3 subunit epsilon